MNTNTILEVFCLITYFVEKEYKFLAYTKACIICIPYTKDYILTTIDHTYMCINY